MPDEIIEIDLKDLEEKKSREERKANGRFAAVAVALVLLILAIYHAWIRKTAVLAGILVPALIMILYGGWVIFLTKRDKKRRLFLARQMEETARCELAASKLPKFESENKNSNENDSNNLYFTTTNSKSLPDGNLQKNNVLLGNSTFNGTGLDIKKSHHHKSTSGEKHKKRKHKKRTSAAMNSNDIYKMGTPNGGVKRPSFRQRLFKQIPQTLKNEQTYLKLPPYLHRTNSAP